MKHLALNMLLALAVTMLAAGPVAASEKDDVMKVVQQFVDGFNKGDTKAALATCAPRTSIVDEFPPYAWHGEGGCSKWVADFDVDAKKNGITDGVVTLKQAKHVDVTADRAYVVVPADYAYKQQGKDVKQLGSIMTVALQKEQAGWLIVGWAWSRL